MSQVVERGCTPSEATLGAMIALFGRKQQLKEAMAIFYGTYAAPSTLLYNAIVKACVNCGRMDEAMRLFEEMETRGIGHDHITVTSMIHAFTKVGQYTLG